MGINYLLFLQNLRENILGGQWNDFAVRLSDFIVGFWPIAFVAVIFWSIDKKWGKLFLLNTCLGNLVNGLLKMTACVYRPWIKDARVIPAGDAMTLATGYSFPSGHATASVEYYGTTVLWQWKKHRWISFVMLLLIALTLFSRNFLGVHTPQDVVVGFFATTLIVLLTPKLLSWMEGGGKMRPLVVVGIFAGLALVDYLYINLKPYPLDYVGDALLVDPEKMKPDSYEGIGACLGFAVGWLTESRWIRFEKIKNTFLAILTDVLALVPLYFIKVCMIDAVQGSIGRPLAKLLTWFLMFLYIMILVPLVIRAVGKREV